MAYSEEDIQVIRWPDAIRRRPAMYLGDTGRLGVRFLARELLETPHSPRALFTTVNGASLVFSSLSTPISVRPREAGQPIYLVELFTRIEVPIDDPPSVAPLEIVDVTADPVVFREIPRASSIPAIANALSRELVVATRSRGVVTEARFARGVLMQPPTERPTDQQDGVQIRVELDPEIFGRTLFLFEDLAQELRDLSLRRRVDVELRDEGRHLLFKATGSAG